MPVNFHLCQGLDSPANYVVLFEKSEEDCKDMIHKQFIRNQDLRTEYDDYVYEFSVYIVILKNNMETLFRTL